jgi:hypothetical protein
MRYTHVQRPTSMLIQPSKAMTGALVSNRAY